MKTVWCLVFLAIALVEGKAIYFTVPQDYVSDILKASADCVTKHGVEQDILKKIIAWTVEDTELFRKYLFCFTKSAGFADDEGRLTKDKMMKFVGNDSAKAEFESVIDGCNQLKGSDENETVFKTASCFQAKSPILFKV